MWQGRRLNTGWYPLVFVRLAGAGGCVATLAPACGLCYETEKDIDKMQSSKSKVTSSLKFVSLDALVSTAIATVGAVLFVTCGLPAMINAEIAKR